MRDYEYEKAVIAHWGVPNMKRPHGLKYNTKGRNAIDKNQNDSSRSSEYEERKAGARADAQKAKVMSDAQRARQEYLKKKYKSSKADKETKVLSEKIKKASNPFNMNTKTEMERKKNNKVEKKKSAKEGYANSVVGQIEQNVKEKRQQSIDNWNNTVNKLKGHFAYAKMTDKGRQKTSKVKKQETSKREYENSVFGELDKAARRRAAKRDEKLPSSKLNDLGTRQEKLSTVKKEKGQEMLDQMNPFTKKKKKKG